jgi:ferric-dicitrate binding protein FerR (iron transport regulator)
MEDVLESLLFFDELSPRRRTDLRRHLEDNPDLADAFAAWKEAHRVVRRRFREDLPARRLLVLYALAESGRAEMLGADERDALEAARDDIETAVEAHPALDDILTAIEDEADDFEAVWAERGAEVDASATDPGAGVDGIDTTVGASPDAAGTDGREDRAPRSPDARGSTRFARRVAGGALLVMVAVLVWFVWPSSPQMVTVTAEDGEVKRVDLVDGSTVRLAGAAEMRYEESTGEAFDRQISLTYGRAFFDIQEQKRPQPFVVETPTATATVLGTQFGVTALSDSTDVVLASGKVEVGARERSDAVVLSPGQHSRVIRGEAPSAPQSVDVASALAWSGLFVFRATPVETIADRLRTFYDAPIAVDESLQDEPVTGTFDQDQPVEQILAALAATLGASVEGSEAEGYRLRADE